MAFDLASFLGAGETRLAQNQQAQQATGDIYSSMAQQIFDQQGNITQDSRGVTPLEAQTKGLAELEAQQRTQEMGRALGLNPDLSADLQVQLATRRTEALKQSMAQQDIVAQMQSVGLFDDPLQYLVNQVTLPAEVRKLNAAQGIVDMASQQINQIAADTTAAAQTSKLIATHTSQALVDDQINAVEAEIRNKKLAIGVQGDLALSHMVKDLNSLQGDQLQIRGQMLQAQNSAESLQMQRAARNDAVKLHSLQMEKYQDEKDRIAYIADTINVARSNEGKAPIDPRMFKNVWGTNTPVGKELLADYERGAAYSVGMPVASGDTILGRVQMLNTLPPSDKYTDGSKKLASAQAQAVAAAMAANKGAKPEVIEAAAADIFAKQSDNWRRKVDPKDQTNPNSLLPLDALDQSKALATNPAYALYRQVTPDNRPFNTSEFMWNATANIKAGKLKLDDAVKAVQLAATYSTQQNDVLNRTYFITGQHTGEIGVPVEYYSNAQVVARYATAVGAAGTLAAAGTGVGLPAAAGIGAVTAGLGKFSAGPQTSIISPTNAAQVRYAFAQMIGSSINTNALTGVGAQSLQPLIQNAENLGK